MERYSSNPQIISVPTMTLVNLLPANWSRRGVEFINPVTDVVWVWIDNTVTTNRGIPIHSLAPLTPFLLHNRGDLVTRQWFAFKSTPATVSLIVSELYDDFPVAEYKPNVSFQSSKSDGKGSVQCYTTPEWEPYRNPLTPIDCSRLLSRLGQTRRSW